MIPSRRALLTGAGASLIAAQLRIESACVDLGDKRILDLDQQRFGGGGRGASESRPDTFGGIGSERSGRVISPVSIFLQRLHHDPVEFTAQRLADAVNIRAAVFGNGRQILGFQRADANARSGRIDFANHPPHLIKTRFS